jgi:hypothetical protein
MLAAFTWSVVSAMCLDPVHDAMATLVGWLVFLFWFLGGFGETGWAESSSVTDL